MTPSDGAAKPAGAVAERPPAPTNAATQARILVVTGMSGSGKSTAIRALEDAGYFCIDNLPIVLLPRLLELFAHALPEWGSGAGEAAQHPSNASGPGDLVRRIAVVVDAREGRFLDDTPAALRDVRESGHRVDVVFLDTADEVLSRRYSETRRRHPLAPFGTVEQGIADERSRLAALRAIADDVIDTTRLNVHELKGLLTERYGGAASGELAVQVLSFGFKHGIPSQADLVLDVRFLPNPYFVAELKAYPGTDARVSAWVLERPDAERFLSHAMDMLEFLLPRYRAEGKSYLTIALGCTGGRHRSVALGEALAKRLERAHHAVRVQHRDVERE